MQAIKAYINKYKKTAIAVLVLLVLILLLLTAGIFGYYPIAIVNGKPILAHSFYKSFDISRSYYSYFNNHSKEPASQDTLDLALKKAAFDGAIDTVFINQRLKTEMKASELGEKIDNQVNDLFKDEKFKDELLTTVLDASENDAVKYFLNNTIRSEILDGRLRLEGTNLIDWLYKQRKSAKVTILIPGYKWTSDGVEVN